MTADVRAAIRDHIDAGTVDPHTIAAKVAAALTETELRDLAEVLLPDLARECIRLFRGAHVPQGNGKRAMGEATRDALTWPVAIGREWKALGACTREDVLAIAEGYQSRAEANAAMAAAYTALAEAMAERGAATVADLPDDVVTGVLA